MNERIRILRKELGLTLEKFGEHIGIKKSSLSTIESGKSNASEQTIKSICREFNVNENWLRNGEGSMFNELSKDDELAKLVGRELVGEDKFIKNVMLTLLKQPKEVRDTLKKFMEDCLDNL